MSVNINIVGIHQPSYLPWLGYIHKMYASDLFILHDNVQFSKNSMYRRTFVRNDLISKSQLVVPLNKHSEYELIKNLTICNTIKWQAKHLNKIRNSYVSSENFKKYFPDISDIILQSVKIENFSNFIEFTLKSLMSLLQIKTPMVRSSNLPVSGYKTEYNIDLLKYFGAKIYLSGAGAFKYYQKVEDFNKHGISILKQEIYEFLGKDKYLQNHKAFMNGLSVIDAIFCVGPGQTKELLEQYTVIMLSEQQNK